MVVTAAGGVAVYATLYNRLGEGGGSRPTPAEGGGPLESYNRGAPGDVGFAEAAATIGAQAGLSTFVSYAAFLLILFLRPPSRLLASWTRPDGDRRPAVLVVVLVVAFTGLLFVPAATDYFGLTHAAHPVFNTVLPALVVWFVLLSAAYRFRVLERALGLAPAA